MPVMVLGLASFLVGCGLGMSDEDRLDRATEAAASADYQAAIVDSKDVLRRDPQNVRARVLLGRVSLAVGDVAGAEKELRRAIELGADSTGLHVDLVDALVRQRKFQDALDAGLDPLLDDESIGTLRRLRGDALRGIGQPAEARTEYGLALQKNADDVRAHLGVAAAHLAAENLPQARINLDALIESYPDEFDVWLASGDLNRLLTELDAAERNYARALEIAGGDVGRRASALYGLAEISLAQGDIEAAEGYVRDLSEATPDTIPAVLSSARLAVLKEDWASAQTDLQDILRRAPDFAPAQMLLGAVSYETGSYAQSEMYLSSALVNEPENVAARVMLASTYLAQGKAADAAEALEANGAEWGGDPRVIAMSARVALSAGETDRAIRDLERSVELNPTDTAAQLQLALALIGAGRQGEVSEVLDTLSEIDGERTALQREILGVLVKLRGGNTSLAREHARKIVGDWPEEAAGYNLVGAIELADGNVEVARSSFSDALENAPGNVVAERFLAQIAEGNGELEEAAVRYERIVATDSSATWAMYGRARVAATAEQLDLAAEWLERILPREPGATAPRETLARVHAQNGDFDAAMEVASGLIALDTGRAESHLLLGDIAARKQDFEAAIDAFEDARRLDPGNPQITLRLAEARRLSGDVEAALATLGGEGDIDYTDLRTASATALAFSNAGNHVRAMEIAASLKRAHPDSAGPIALEGELWIRASEFERAAAAYEAALAIEVNPPYAARLHQILMQTDEENADEPLHRYLASDPDDSSIQLLLAQYLNREGQNGDSIGVYENILSVNPDDGIALNNLAWLYYTQGDDRAIATARKAREAMPRNWSVLDTLGWVLVEAGEFDEGIEILREAESLSEGAAVVRYHLAEGYARAGRRDEARDILQELLADGSEDFDGRGDAERLLAEL